MVGGTPLISLRLEAGWDPNPYEVNGDHLILECIRGNSAWGFEALLKAGLNPNISVTRYRDVSILSECIVWGREELVSLALKYGADPNAGRALDSALVFGSTGIIMDLLKHGADPNVKDYRGETSLFMAYYNFDDYNCNYNHIVCLLEHGADLTAMNNKGETVLDLMIMFMQKWSKSDVSVTELLRFPFRFSEHVKNHPEARRVWFRRKLTTLKCIVKFLSVHQRAVISANHPSRLKEMGVFEV
jgi:hypothetical protein